MLGILDDKRRGGRSKAPDPFRTGPLYAPLRDMAAVSRMSCVGPTTPRPRQPFEGCSAVYEVNCYRALPGAPLPGAKNPARLGKVISGTAHQLR